jgi:putative ABC transport system permease protein
MNMPVWLSNKNDAIMLNYYYADEKFAPSIQLRFICGNNFPPASVDDEKERYIVLNERAVHALWLHAADKAVGQKLWLNDSTQLTITGVLKDFIYENAGKQIAPLAFRNKKDAGSFLYVQTEPGG